MRMGDGFKLVLFLGALDEQNQMGMVFMPKFHITVIGSMSGWQRCNFQDLILQQTYLT